MADWYRKEATHVVSLLATDAQAGLTEAKARQRLAEHGPNELVERGLKSPWRILWEQLSGLMVVILIVAAIISGVLGDWKQAIAILAIVVLNAVLSFSQEFRAEKAMAALKKLAVPTVKVWRDGHRVEIPARDLVLGDVVLLVEEVRRLCPGLAGTQEGLNLRLRKPAATPVHLHEVYADEGPPTRPRPTNRT